MVSQRSRVFALLAALAALPGCLGDDDETERPRSPTATAPAPVPGGARISADFAAEPRNGASMSGFLHSLEHARPADSAIRPLRPRLWRSIPSRAPYERVRALGAVYQLVLSDLWGYPKDDWSGRGPPWEGLDRWARVVRRAARSFRGRPIEWDVWNEPDAPEYWSGTREQFFRVYETAARVLVDELGTAAVVGGPSTRGAFPSWVGGLLRHCRRRGCRVSFVSYHANLKANEPIPNISKRLREVRRNLLPLYEDPSLRRILINESVGPTDQYRPGEIVGYLFHMEVGGADGAARSCWPYAEGGDNCSDGTLEGLLTPEGEPRSAWWAYRAYAEGAEARVPSRSDNWAVDPLASAGAGSARLLLGRVDRGGPETPAIPVELDLSGLEQVLGEADAALVTVERLPDTGKAPLAAPLRVSRRRMALGAAPLRVSAGELGSHEALIVTVSPG